jgi:trichoplein keratin filament-binding protein
LRRYYDRWGRITSQHEHWSSPEFYNQIEKRLEKEKSAEKKEKELDERKERLRNKLLEEKRQFELELKQPRRPISSRSNVSNNVLESVRQTLANAEESRSRADLESKLYSRWRLGLDHEKILKESKNSHHAIAKLSWLDRQIENQMQNEKQKQETHKIELELEQEKRKHEAYVQSRQEMRQIEINQLKSLQENNIHEHKLRERELNDCKLTQNVMRKKLNEIQKEIENINSTNVKRRDQALALHNFRKIKMLMRERSDAIKRNLVQDMNLLNRISNDQEFDNDEEIKYLR